MRTDNLQPSHSFLTTYATIRLTLEVTKLLRHIFTLVCIVAASIANADTIVSGTQNGRAITVSSKAALHIEQLATAFLVSADYEAPADIATQARWAAALRGPHISIAFSEPRTFSFTFSTTGPARQQPVSAEQIIIPASAEHGPDYILVRFHDRIRAFAKFSYDANTAFRRAIPSTQNQ